MPVDKNAKLEQQKIQQQLETKLFPQDIAKNTGDPLLYSIGSNLTNWYQALPYGFKNNRRDGSARLMFLPISPSNMQVTTHYATNIIPTLYGTVEEHSEQRYFDINISGTTGFSPRYPHIMDSNSKDGSYQNLNAVTGPKQAAYDASVQDTNRRESFAVHEPILGGVTAFLGPTVNKITSIINKTINTAKIATDALGITENREPATGVVPETSGYAAFHNLYRFLLSYKNDLSGIMEGGDEAFRQIDHPLQFLNYKDNIQYDVAVRTFTLARTADNPMLYNYTIVLRAYNLRSLFDENLKRAGDALALRLRALGLSTVTSSGPFNKMKNLSCGIKGTAGAVKGLGELF